MTNGMRRTVHPVAGVFAKIPGDREDASDGVDGTALWFVMGSFVI
jgi:hypothetical protein